ncbi:hypothetical protein [Nocardia otitidiscaviarum]|nr:hypothetical protein [Nocardia otitidiscaviarum]
MALTGASIGITMFAVAQSSTPGTVTPAPNAPSPNVPVYLSSVAELNGKLTKAVDPKTPPAEQRGLFQGGAAPQLTDPKTIGRPGTPVMTYQVVEVKPAVRAASAP